MSVKRLDVVCPKTDADESRLATFSGVAKLGGQLCQFGVVARIGSQA